jgi:hypothetical protein
MSIIRHNPHRLVNICVLSTDQRAVTVGIMKKISAALALTAFGIFVLIATGQPRAQVPGSWNDEWPKTDFSKRSVELSEIISGGPPKDGIPSIDNPKFVLASSLGSDDLADTEPVVGVSIKGKMRAYPLRVLTWHEIVNDTFNGVPITVTYCPLCNSAIVFDRRLDGKLLDFGTTGKLRNSDMVMYDRQTESWWQQFLGEGIAGEMTGKSLKMLPSRLESFANFKKRAPNGEILVPGNPNMRNYGTNPYTGYDSASRPFLYYGDMPDYINPMVRVVVVEGKAWAMPLLVNKGNISDGDLTLSWTAGQNSALDQRSIRKGRDVGNVVVQRKGADGKSSDVVYDVTFAFVYHVFHNKKRIVIN